MLKRRTLVASTAVLPLTSLIPAAWAATPKDTVVFASQIDDVVTCDPGEAYEISAQIFLSSIYDRLVRYEAEDLTKLVGGVAESWTVSPDAKTYTFKLRPNQKFESGAPVTADDMAFSLQRVVIMNKTPAFLFTQLGWTPDNVRDLVKAPDAQTLEFKITEDFAPTLVLNLMATVAASVVEKKVAMANEASGDLGNTWLKTHSATSGPYRLVSWKAAESVTMEANPGYHLGAPKTRRVIIRHVPEPGSQRLLLEKGDIDIALSLQPDQLKPLAGNKDIKVESFPYSGTWYIALNLGDERLKNPKVRLALKYLVDYYGMTDTFLKGRFGVHQTFLPIGLSGAIEYDPYKLDVAKAKALLAEAGYPNGFELRLSTPEHLAPDRHGPIGAADHGPSRHQGDPRRHRSETDGLRISRPQIHGDADQLDPGLPRPAHQRLDLRLQRQRRRRRAASPRMALPLFRPGHQCAHHRGGKGDRPGQTHGHVRGIAEARDR